MSTVHDAPQDPLAPWVLFAMMGPSPESPKGDQVGDVLVGVRPLYGAPVSPRGRPNQTPEIQVRDMTREHRKKLAEEAKEAAAKEAEKEEPKEDE